MYHRTLNCQISSEWSNIPSHSSNETNQLQCKNLNSPSSRLNYVQQQDNHRFGYLESDHHHNHQDYMSITSTPMSITQKNLHGKINNLLKPSSKTSNHLNHDHKDIKVNSTASEKCRKASLINPSEQHTTLSTYQSSSQPHHLTTRRHLIVFKIIEQIVDVETKNILEEKIIKDDEYFISFDSVSSTHHQDHSSSIDKTTLTDASSLQPLLGSSGLLADVSGMSNSKSFTQLSSSIETNDKNRSKVSSKVNNKNSDPKNQLKNTDGDFIDDRPKKVNNDVMNEDDKERGAASALLSLQTAKTPVKSETNGTMDSSNFNKCTSTNSVAKNNSKVKDVEALLPSIYIERLKPGTKIMAKWKDKNFYPAEVVKQNEIHKWMVKFEDNATRNLFESEIIRIENLIPNQEIMVKISDDLFKISLMKKIIKTGRNYDFELEHFDEDEKTKVSKRYPLKDIFLYSEQGSLIQSKSSKSNQTGAVFADVDLDNIVSGKRIRQNKSVNPNSLSTNKTILSQNQTQENPLTGKKCKTHHDLSTQPENKNTTINKRRRINNDNCAMNKSNNALNNDATVSNDTNQSQLNKKTSKKAVKNIHLSIVDNYFEESLALSPHTSSHYDWSSSKSEFEKIHGPIPKSGSKLFQNLNFIITCGLKQLNDHNIDVDSDHSSERGNQSNHNFNKLHLIKQITSGGGIYFETFNELKVGFQVYNILQI